MTENIGADVMAADATYTAAVQTAYVNEIAAYGGAEATEATNVGQAQIALATAQGANEENLASEEAGVANTLQAETVAAQEPLEAALAEDADGDSQAVASDEAATTSTEGGIENSSEQQLAAEEVSVAGLLAAAQADYAIDVAQVAANAADSYYQSLVDSSGNALSGISQATADAAQFDAIYAEGYVTWLTDLKPVFVADASQVAQASASDEETVVAEQVTLADQEAQDNVNSLATDLPQSEQESSQLTALADGYQTAQVAEAGQESEGVATADYTQMIDLANAAAAYMLACAKADKAIAMNQAQDVPSGDQYTKDLADARLTLADREADADLAWIDAKAAADEPIEVADAAAWQSMTDGEATLEDNYAHTSDGENQADGDALAQQQADVLTADAGADATQGNSDAAADADFQIAQANETATVWQSIVTSFPLQPVTGGASGVGLPWAQTQAALAGAEAAWAVTAAGNYQQYVSQLGLAEIAYEATNTAQFVNEMKNIDAADDTAGNAVADADKTLTVTAAGDEVTLEDMLATAGHQYQHDLGQAAHDYRQAVAQAEHDLAVGLIGPGDATAQETHDNAVAAAEAAKTAAENAADQTFADTVQPVLSQTGTDEAEANFTDAQTGDGANYTDITGNNAAVDGYDDAESAAYDQEQQADATALDAMQVANATGHAAAIAAWAANFTVSPGFDSSGNPLPAVSSPWAQQAADQASADAAQQISLAAAQLAQSVSQAQSQDQQEQSQADALETKDNGDALAEQTKADGDAASQETSDEAQADVPSAVFDYLPDRLVPPSDGPAPVLTADYWLGYEANDFWLGPTWDFYGHSSGALSLGFEYFPVAPPNVMPDLPAPYWAYEWQGYGHNMPWGLLGAGYSTFDPSQYASPDVNQVIGGASGGVYGNGNVLWVRDVMRDDAPDRLTTVYQSPTHFSGTDASLLEVSNTPSFIGDWSTTPAPLPTLTDDATDTAPPAPSKTADFAAQEAPGATPPSPATSEGSSPSDQQTAAAAAATAAAATGPGGVANAAMTLTLYVIFSQPDTAAEQPELKNDAKDEITTSTDGAQRQLNNADGSIQATRKEVYGREYMLSRAPYADTANLTDEQKLVLQNSKPLAGRDYVYVSDGFVYCQRRRADIIDDVGSHLWAITPLALMPLNYGSPVLIGQQAGSGQVVLTMDYWNRFDGLPNVVSLRELQAAAATNPPVLSETKYLSPYEDSGAIEKLVQRVRLGEFEVEPPAWWLKNSVMGAAETFVDALVLPVSSLYSSSISGQSSLYKWPDDNLVIDSPVPNVSAADIAHAYELDAGVDRESGPYVWAARGTLVAILVAPSASAGLGAPGSFLSAKGMAGGTSRGIRNSVPLTFEQRAQVVEAARAIGIDVADIEFFSGTQGSVYSDLFDRIFVGPNIFPDAGAAASGARSVFGRLSLRVALAHENGHMVAARNGIAFPAGIMEEFQANVLAARYTIGLNNVERYQLLRNALEEAAAHGVEWRELRLQVKVLPIGD